MNEWFQAEFHADRAHQFYESGQWDKALAELRLALAFDPNQSDWHFGMGLALEALQRFEEAVESFQHVLRLRGGEDLDSLLHIGVDQMRCGHHEAAIDALSKASKVNSECEPAYCNRILAYAQLGKHEQAEEMFYLARQVTEECPLCYDHIAHSLESRGELDRAVWCWEQSLRIDPHHPDAYGNLARVSRDRGQPERAHQYFLQQLRETPGDVPTLLELGRLLMDMGRQAEAGEKFRRALEMDPTDAAAHQHLGELALLAGHLDAAAAELDLAGRFAPHRPGIHLALAQVAQKRNQLESARFHIQAELDHPLHSHGQTLALAQLLIELRDPQPVIDLLNPLLESPQAAGLDTRLVPGAWLCRGVAHMLCGQPTVGIHDCRKAYRFSRIQASSSEKKAASTTRNAGMDMAAHNLALAYLTQRRLTRARIWLRRAATANPDDPQIRLLSHSILRARIAAVLRGAVQRVTRLSRR